MCVKLFRTLTAKKSLCEEFMVRWRCEGYDDAVRTLEGEFAAIGRIIPY